MKTLAASEWKNISPESTALTKVAGAGGIKNLDPYLENEAVTLRCSLIAITRNCPYSHAHESWFIWDGNRWLADALENVHQLALELSKTLAADLLKTPGRPDNEN